MRSKLRSLLLLITLIFTPLLPAYGDNGWLPQEPELLEELIITQFIENNSYFTDADLRLGFVYILKINKTLPEKLKEFYGAYGTVVISEVFIHDFSPPFRQLQLYAFGLTKQGTCEKTDTPDIIRAKLFDMTLFADLDFEIISFE